MAEGGTKRGGRRTGVRVTDAPDTGAAEVSDRRRHSAHHGASSPKQSLAERWAAIAEGSPQELSPPCPAEAPDGSKTAIKSLRQGWIEPDTPWRGTMFTFRCPKLIGEVGCVAGALVASETQAAGRSAA